MTPLRRPYLGLLQQNRSFRRLWLAQLISLGGDWFNLIALTAALLRITGSSFYAGAVLAAGFVPQFLLSPIGGVVADRLDRRRLMLGANLAAAVLALAMLAVHSRQSVWLGLAAMAGIAAAGAFFDPAARAGLPNVVAPEQLGAANVLMASAWGVMAAVGAAAGGIVVGVLGQDAAFVINSCSFLVSAALILGVRAGLGPTGERRPELHPLRDLREGVGWARSDGRVVALLAQRVGFGLGSGMIGLLGVFATRVFGAGDAGIGLLFAARGIGSLLGPFGARAFVGGEVRRLFPAIAAAMALFGVAYALFPAAPGIWGAAAIVLVAHLGGGTQYTMAGYGLQLLAPDGVRGRIMAFELGAVTLSMSLSILGAGWAAQRFDPRAVVEVLAAVTIVYAAAWTLATRHLWRAPVPGRVELLRAAESS